MLLYKASNSHRTSGNANECIQMAAEATDGRISMILTNKTGVVMCRLIVKLSTIQQTSCPPIQQKLKFYLRQHQPYFERMRDKHPLALREHRLGGAVPNIDIMFVLELNNSEISRAADDET